MTSFTDEYIHIPFASFAVRGANLTELEAKARAKAMEFTQGRRFWIKNFSADEEVIMGVDSSWVAQVTITYE